MAQVDFEFFKILLPGMNKNTLRLPPKFMGVLGNHRELKVWLHSSGAMPLWDMKLVSSGDGVYLGRGWSQFAQSYDFMDGDLLVFRYDGGGVLTIKAFDRSTCGKEYPHAIGTIARHINEPTHFAVTLKAGNLKEKQGQYLNVPAPFQEAHGYHRRRKVVLRIGGRSWTISMKLNWRQVRDCVVFRYGWHMFCIDNGLEVGDTCFFQVVCDGEAGSDVEMEEADGNETKMGDEAVDDVHILKVEGHKKDGYLRRLTADSLRPRSS